jgi:hypothetical protein
LGNCRRARLRHEPLERKQASEKAGYGIPRRVSDHFPEQQNLPPKGPGCDLVPQHRRRFC